MIYNSTRIMNEYSINTIFNEGNRYISNCFNPSELNVLNEVNIKNIGKTIIEAIKKAFKWIWDKLKQLGAFIKKKFTDISNKIRGIDIDINIDDKDTEEFKEVEIIILDSDKAIRTINKLETEFQVSMMFKGVNEIIRSFVTDIKNSVDFCKSNIKSSSNSAINVGKIGIDKRPNYDYNKDKWIIDCKEDCKNNLDRLYKKLDDAKNNIKKINDEELGGFLDIGKNFDINDVCDALKKKYSFYEEDGSLKKEYQKKITIDSSEDSKKYLKELYDNSIKLNKYLSDACAKNTTEIYKEINDYQKLADYIVKVIDESTVIIESIDSTLAAEFAKKTKELAEIAAKKAAEEARIKAEMDKIAAENAAKITAGLDKYKKEVEEAQTDKEIVNAFKDIDVVDNGIDDEKWEYRDKKNSAFYDSLTVDKIKKLCAPEFTIEEFVCLSALRNRPHQSKLDVTEMNMSKINKEYYKVAQSAERKLAKIIKTKYDKFNMLYDLCRTRRVKEILKDYYDKIIIKPINRDDEEDVEIYSIDSNGLKKAIADNNISYNDIKKWYVFRYLFKIGVDKRYFDLKTQYEYSRVTDGIKNFMVNSFVIGGKEFIDLIENTYPSIKQDCISILLNYIKNITHNSKRMLLISSQLDYDDDIGTGLMLYFIVKNKKMLDLDELKYLAKRKLDEIKFNRSKNKDTENKEFYNDYKKFLNEESLFTSINNYNVFSEIKFM